MPATNRMRCPARICSALVAVWLTGCAAGNQTTRIRHADLDDLVHEMVESLAASDFLRGRTPDSAPWRIVIDKVQNLSSDVVSEAEQWMVVARVRGAVPLRSFASTRNITFQFNPQRAESLRRAGVAVRPIDPAFAPTHLMSATFRSLRRAGRARSELTDLRAETYLMSFRIVDLQSRAIEWMGQFAFKRQAEGLLID
jgi:hypothetical protein